MDLNKSRDFFNPMLDNSRVHIIGAGSVGSTIAENLARCGIERISLWDFDKVESHNIVNQMYTESHIGYLKAEALKNMLVEINPRLKDTIELHEKGWTDETPSGYIFLCVDSIDIRKEFFEKNKYNSNIKLVFDVRTALESAQCYTVNWKSYDAKKEYEKSMDFTHEEAMKSTPVSACGMILGVATTVRLISALAVNSYINYIKGNGIRKFLMIDGFHFILDAF